MPKQLKQQNNFFKNNPKGSLKALSQFKTKKVPNLYLSSMKNGSGRVMQQRTKQTMSLVGH